MPATLKAERPCLLIGHINTQKIYMVYKISDILKDAEKYL